MIEVLPRLVHDVERLVEQFDRLRQIDDVDAVPVTIDVGCHTRVPALCLVTEVNASLEQLTQRKIWKRHIVFLSGLRLGRRFRVSPTGGRNKDVSLGGPPSPVK